MLRVATAFSTNNCFSASASSCALQVSFLFGVPVGGAEEQRAGNRPKAGDADKIILEKYPGVLR